MFLHMVPDQRNTKASLVTEDVIIGLSLVFRRLEEKSHTQMFLWPIFYGNKTVCSKHYYFKK